MGCIKSVSVCSSGSPWDVLIVCRFVLLGHHGGVLTAFWFVLLRSVVCRFVILGSRWSGINEVSVCSAGVTMGCISRVGLFFWRSRWDVLIVSVCSSGVTMGCINSVGLFFWRSRWTFSRHPRIAVFFIIIIMMSTTCNSRLFP